MESLYPFPEDIIIEDRPTAHDYGDTMSYRGPIDRCLVMWVDGKKAERLAASAVSYLDIPTEHWIDSATINTLYLGAKYSLEAEFIAIKEAFRIAHERTEDFDRLIILSDCQSILKGLRNASKFRSSITSELVDELFFYANSFYDSGVTVEIRWVPAHSFVAGNERVDEVATHVRRSAQRILTQEAPSRFVKDLTLTSLSMESIYEALFGEGIFGYQDEETSSYDGGMMEDGVLDSDFEISDQILQSWESSSIDAPTEISTPERPSKKRKRDDSV
ncbi:hypothetical protein BS50DRAFT_593982 [Corynespora cassiicola Philippines]|uniref:RNase H type-1 domain-containing protein n=1 Tax=Corynespora cassiicola Philippines TaxID=1448308 RepID=A0A2T2N4A1_CORCC|nr:hypothetical protein BS50DRAFT_593982 [Corynespora cassiicola Philippines]